MKLLALSLVLGLTACGGHNGGNVQPTVITVSDPMTYLAQSINPDGNPATYLNGSQPWTYLRQDYTVQVEQSFCVDASDCYTIWSNPPHGPFVAANGDGGEKYQLIGNTVYIVETQDGSNPNIQQFGTSWPLFDIYVPACSVGWETIGIPPLQTRACHQAVTFPGSPAPISADTIIAEHGTGQVETFYMVLGWGRLRWEVWQAKGCSPAPAQTTTVTPPASFEDLTLGALCDVRMITNIIAPPTPGLSGNTWGWEP